MKVNYKEKIAAKVVFLMAQNPDNDRWEPMAYFPDIPWTRDREDVKTSYMHNGQHGPCLDSFALIDCIAPRRQHLASVDRLRKELRGIGYDLTDLDPVAFLASKGERKKEIEANVLEAVYVKDSELLMAGTAEKRAAIKAAAQAATQAA